MESHVYCFGSFRLYLAVAHRFCCGIVCLQWCQRLLVAHFRNTILIYTASRAMMYNAAKSASVAEDAMICLMMCAMLSTAPLLAGIVASLEWKKCPPALLRACGSLR